MLLWIYSSQRFELYRAFNLGNDGPYNILNPGRDIFARSSKGSLDMLQISLPENKNSNSNILGAKLVVVLSGEWGRIRIST